MKTQNDTISWVIVLMATSSLIIMICQLQMDTIILGNLYQNNLQLNLQWAKPYWSWGRVAFVLGWFNIIAAITVQLHSISFKRKEVEQLITEVQEEIQKHQTPPHKKIEEPKPTQTPPQPPETNEETPILPGVPDEENPPTTEETPLTNDEIPPTIEEEPEQILPGVI